MRPPAFMALSIQGPLLLLLLVLLAGLPACGTKHYSDGDVRQVGGVQTGVILDVSDVIVEEDPSLVGPGIGAAAGGLLGSAFSTGTGRGLLMLGGGLIGADVGGYGEINYKKRRYRAVQLTMQMDKGGVLVVVQGDSEYFVRGDRVRVLFMDEERAAVQHL